MFADIFIVTLIPLAWAIPIDNGVEGDPEIECGATGMTINFNTRNAFEGHVYVKGRFAEEGCRSDEGGRRVAGMTLAFSACGTERTRSLNPRGVFVRQTVVVSFHPQFLTKVDRAYTIQCFYMEAEKTVSQELEVSDITTAFQSQVVPMPVCRYDILEGGPTGQPVKFAVIGQMVFHKWTCDTETTDIFCMLVHSCSVDDGAGNVANLLNENGCGLDRHLLQNLEYTTDLMAGRESHVFKYADKAALFFSCQISITIKEPGEQCAKPNCGEPGGPGNGGLGATGGTRGPGPVRTPPPKVASTPGARPLAPVATKASAAPPSSTPPKAVTPGATVQTTPSAVATGANLPLAASTGGSVSPSASSAPSATSTGPPATGSVPPVTTAAIVSLPPVTATVATLAPAPLVLNDSIARNDAGGRQKRHSAKQNILGVWDVRAQPITALDLDEDFKFDSNNAIRKQLSSQNLPVSAQKSIPIDFCLSPSSFSLIIATTVVAGLIAGVLSMVLCLRRSTKL